MSGHTEVNDEAIVFEKAVKARKRTEDVTEKMKEGRHIHQKLEELGKATVTELVLATGHDWSRIEQHIKWALEKGYAKRSTLRMANKK